MTMLPGDCPWRHTPLEFVDVPAGAVVGDTLIGLVLQGKICPDCVPAGYSLRYCPNPAAPAPSDPRAWTVTVTHGPGCPGMWIRQQQGSAGESR